MVARAAAGQPGRMDEERRLSIDVGQQVRPRLAVGGIVRFMRRFVDGIDGHGMQCNVGGAMSRNELLLAHLDRPIPLPRDERVELLGGKGDGLMRMAGELGLPVPPGFVLTTRACASHRERGWTSDLEEALRTGIEALERQTGRRFGGGRDDAGAERKPLFVSVRSGAPVSMPGMLDTVLNVGLDARTAAALAQTHPRLADECRIRLADSFRTSVGHAPPEDVWVQLRDAVEAVFQSADSARARAYRRREGLEGEGLTAVNVQTMVFGNQDERSATGVFFTRDPATGENRPYGDLLFQAQGEDVVSGRHATVPLAELEGRLPDAARSLYAIGRRLEQSYRDLCEIEFTIESGRLWLLQVRVGKRSARAALRIAADLALDPDFPLDRREAVERTRALLVDPPRVATIVRDRRGDGASIAPAKGAESAESVQPLARGLGASPGIATGELATTIARALARAADGHRVLLARPETSPDDVEGMAVACGLLTARGGLASHAAVVARGWGIPAVVGLAALSIDEGGIELAGRRIGEGELLSIDGTTGFVYAGPLDVERSVVPEAAQLIAWAGELGLDLVRDLGREPIPAAASSRAEAPALRATPDSPVLATTPDALDDALVRALSIKGTATRDALAPALATDAETLDPVLDALVLTGDVVAARPIGFRLTDAGRLRAKVLLASDQAALGVDVARSALEAFQPLDLRMKEAVTDWQLRLDGAERVPNDHTNARWDASVVERLATICSDTVPWLADLAARLPRLARDAARLGLALEKIREGDGRFVASPRVDSLHGVWFELHEDLIRLASSSRAEELAAGRTG
jgi:pyruvate,orthophosphate dikinase